MSKGSEELLQIVKEIFCNQKIELEYNVADRGGLYIDIFLPGLLLGFEFDGRQHGEFIEHFHGDRASWIASRKRDLEKDDLCKTKGITLVRIDYTEEMTKENILLKIEEAMNA